MIRNEWECCTPASCRYIVQSGTFVAKCEDGLSLKRICLFAEAVERRGQTCPSIGRSVHGRVRQSETEFARSTETSTKAGLKAHIARAHVVLINISCRQLVPPVGSTAANHFVTGRC